MKKLILILNILLISRLIWALPWSENDLANYPQVQEKLKELRQDGWIEINKTQVLETFSQVIGSSHQIRKFILYIPIQTGITKSCIAAEFISGGASPAFKEFIYIGSECIVGPAKQ